MGIIFSIDYRNTGDLPADGVIIRCVSLIADHLLSEVEESQYADKAGSLQWYELKLPNEIEPGEARFITCPVDDKDIAASVDKTDQVLSGKSRFYLFLAAKYRDISLPQGVTNTTEFCGWFSENLEVRHTCGRNRIFHELINH